MTDLYSRILNASMDRAIPLLQQNAAWAWVVEQSILMTAAGQIGIIGGVGVDEQVMLHGDPEADRIMYERIRAARRLPVSTWHGLDVRHLYRQNSGEFNQFDVLASLNAGTKYLTQPLLDFLTFRDESSLMIVGSAIGDPSGQGDVREIMEYSKDEFELAYAFRAQMVEEAEPHRRRVSSGVYVLEHEPLDWLDRQIGYDELRLVIQPTGIFVSVLLSEQGWYFPFYWTPEGTNTSQMFVHTRGVFALDALMACIWRDACVVREVWSEKRQGSKGYTFKNRPKHDSPVVLPKVVYRSRWGSSAEREYIDARNRSAHAVRAFYRRLPEGAQSHDAEFRAAGYGYPAPPEGHTFVKPHTRGTGTVDPDAVSARRVVCKGLHVAKIVLG